MTWTARQQIQRLDRVLSHVQKLGYAERRWLMARLTEVECADALPERVLMPGDRTYQFTGRPVSTRRSP